jgi:hypothetical protein
MTMLFSFFYHLRRLRQDHETRQALQHLDARLRRDVDLIRPRAASARELERELRDWA